MFFREPTERGVKTMIQISYAALLGWISVIWCAVRGCCIAKGGRVNPKRELQLLLCYICIVVVARFSFFPFSTVNGKIQPLIFDAARAFPFRVNWVPLVNLLDYPEKRDALINVIGNVTMFIPLGIVWPIAYRELNTPLKVISAGVGFSLCIEILQLPFYDRVSDVDDLLLNSIGFVLGYLLYLLVRRLRRGVRKAEKAVTLK